MHFCGPCLLVRPYSRADNRTIVQITIKAWNLVYAFFEICRKDSKVEPSKNPRWRPFFKMAAKKPYFTQFSVINVCLFGRINWNLVCRFFRICRKDPAVEQSKNPRWRQFFKMAAKQPCFTQFSVINVCMFGIIYWNLVCTFFGICRKDPAVKQSENPRWRPFFKMAAKQPCFTQFTT